MGDTNRDPRVDAEFEADADDPRSDLQQTVEARADELKKHPANGTSPLESAGTEDGVGGTAGVVKNQDQPDR